MLFGQAMLSQCILAELRWTGAVFDERSGHLAQRDRPAPIAEDGE